jgi:hypothetical protein
LTASVALALDMPLKMLCSDIPAPGAGVSTEVKVIGVPRPAPFDHVKPLAWGSVEPCAKVFNTGTRIATVKANVCNRFIKNTGASGSLLALAVAFRRLFCLGSDRGPGPRRPQGLFLGELGVALPCRESKNASSNGTVCRLSAANFQVFVALRIAVRLSGEEWIEFPVEQLRSFHSIKIPPETLCCKGEAKRHQCDRLFDGSPVSRESEVFLRNSAERLQ